MYGQGVSHLQVTATNDMSSMTTRRTAHGGLTDFGLTFPVLPCNKYETFKAVHNTRSGQADCFSSSQCILFGVNLIQSTPLRIFFLPLALGPTLVMASSFLMFLDHNQRHATVSRTPLGA